jgi:putative SOS response-associated peptidase YedK
MHDWTALLGDWPEKVPLSHNVAPSQTIPVYTEAGGQGMRWGLIPNWSTDLSSKYATFNARLESVAEKPAFKHAWSHAQRCLVPALGYYEWRVEAGAKQPYFVQREQGPMVFAGLFEPAREQAIPASCTVLTKPASGDMQRLHNRVPVILPVELARHWFSCSAAEALALAEEERTLGLRYFPVSKRVNNPRNDDEDLVRPIAPTADMLDCPPTRNS